MIVRSSWSRDSPTFPGVRSSKFEIDTVPLIRSYFLLFGHFRILIRLLFPVSAAFVVVLSPFRIFALSPVRSSLGEGANEYPCQPAYSIVSKPDYVRIRSCGVIRRRGGITGPAKAQRKTGLASTMITAGREAHLLPCWDPCCQ